MAVSVVLDSLPRSIRCGLDWRRVPPVGMTRERRSVADFFADMLCTRESGEIPFYGIRLRVPELQGASGEKDNSGSARTVPVGATGLTLKAKSLGERFVRWPCPA